MKNLIFEGVVNGKKYDNVADYNRAIMEACQEGTPINAYSQTRNAEEPVQATKESVTDQLRGMMKHLYYGFSEPTLDTSFINNAEAFADIEGASDEVVVEYATDHLQPALDIMNKQQLNAYMGDVKKIANFLQEFVNESTNKEEALERQIGVHKARIEELKKNLDSVSTQTGIGRKMQVYYSVADKMSHVALDNIKAMETIDPSKGKESERAALENLLKLCSEIFPDYDLK